MHEIEMVVNSEQFGILCFSEHWLSSDRLNLKSISGFSLVAEYCRSVNSHGGVALFVANFLFVSCEAVDVSHYCSEIHHEFACVYLKKFKLIVVGVYRSPNGDLNAFFTAFEKLILSVKGYKSAKHVVIGGDFNINVLLNDHKSLDFQNLCRSLGVYCLNYQPTRGEACLDNVVSDLDPRNGGCSVEVRSHGISDHESVVLQLDEGLYLPKPSVSNGTRVKVVRPIKPDNISFFCSRLEVVKWHELFLNNSAESNFESFHGLFMELFYDCFPTKKVKVKPVKNNRPLVNWSHNPALVVKKKWMLLAYDIYKTSKSREDKDRFAKIKREYKLELKQAKMEANARFIESSSNKCSAAWRVINNEAAPRCPRSTSLSPDELNDYFVTSVQQARDSVGALPGAAEEMLLEISQPGTSFELSEVTCDQVISVVKKMKNSDSKDFFGLSNSFIKTVLFYIVLPLTFCINSCIREGVFPKFFKVSKTTPIHKKGSWDLPENFRPVSILPIISKVFEAIIQSQLYNYLESNGLLTVAQYGFRSGLSTIDAVDKVVQAIVQGFESRDFTGVIACDLSKAFDVVDHALLIRKLKFYGVGNTTLSLLESYLHDREQYVSVNGMNSQRRKVAHGVPQGSILGPLLFVVMVNDINVNMGCKVISYADDTTLVCSDNCLDRVKETMSLSLNQVSSWFQANSFLLNVSKTQTMIFALREISNEVDSIKILGVNLDCKLTWSVHIDVICKKLSRLIFLLRNLIDVVPVNYVRSAYFSFCQSLILYGIRLWGCAPDVLRILILQKKAVRIVSKAEHLAHCRPVFVSEKIMTVYSLYVFEAIVYVKTNPDLFVCRSSLHNHNTRNSSTLDVPFVRLRKSQLNSHVQYIKLFNMLPSSAQFQTLSKFKSNLKSLLLAYPLYSLQEFYHLNPVVVSSFFL